MMMTSTLLDFVVRAAVILLAAWVASFALRRSATLQSRVWSMAFTALLALPLLVAVTPRWRVPLGTALPSALSRQVTSPLLEPAPLAIAQTARQETLTRADSASVERPQPTQASSENYMQSNLIPAMSFSFEQMAFGAWLAITAFLLFRIGWSHRSANRIARKTTAAMDAEWQSVVDEARTALHLKRSVDVRFTDAVTLPVVIGVLRPTLLLPMDAVEWPRDTKRIVLLHELAHVVRWDAAGLLIERAVCAAYWFNPLVWFSAHRARSVREQACDDAVLRAGVAAPAYAATLVELAQRAAGVPDASLAIARASGIGTRVRHILNPSIRRTALSTPAAVFVAIAAAGVVAAASTIQPIEREIQNVGSEAFVTPTAQAETFVPAAAPADASQQRDSARRQTPQSNNPALLCGGKGNSTSNSMNDDGRTRRWTVKISNGDCSVDMRVDGKVEFNDDFTDVASLTDGGRFTVDVLDHGVRHELDIRSRSGRLDREWRVNGAVKQYDNDARAWFADFLIQLDRRTAIGADARLPKLLKQGGVDAVLRETALMDGDYARGVYYNKLARAVTLTARDVTAILTQAAHLKTSDYYASELLKSIPMRDRDDRGVHAAILDLINVMDSDYYVSESIGHVLDSGARTAADIDTVVRLVPRMQSDYYKTEVLRRVLKKTQLTPQQRAQLTPVIASMHEDYQMTEFIKLLGVEMDATGRALLMDAATRVSSDHYRSEIITSLVRGASLTDAEIRRLIELSRSLKGDYYRAESLKRLARINSLSERNRNAIVDAASGMPRYYADEVRRAAGIR